MRSKVANCQGILGELEGREFRAGLKTHCTLEIKNDTKARTKWLISYEALEMRPVACLKLFTLWIGGVI